MKTREIDVGSVRGLSSYELAVLTGKFDGTLEEYIDKEQEVYDKTVDYSDHMLAEMEQRLASVTNGSSLDLSELIQARGTYKILGERLDATDEELAVILERLNAIDPSSINVDSIQVSGSKKNIDLRNNGVAIQWKAIGELNWTDLVTLEELTPNVGVGTVTSVADPNMASVKISGTRRNPLFNFVIPRGRDGKDGASGGAIVDGYINDKGELIGKVKNDSNDTIITDEEGNKYLVPILSVGTVETLEHDQPAYVTITGSVTNPKLNFGIPKGRPVKVKGYIDDNGFLVVESE